MVALEARPVLSHSKSRTQLPILVPHAVGFAYAGCIARPVPKPRCARPRMTPYGMIDRPLQRQRLLRSPARPETDCDGPSRRRDAAAHATEREQDRAALAVQRAWRGFAARLVARAWRERATRATVCVQTALRARAGRDELPRRRLAARLEGALAELADVCSPRTSQKALTRLQAKCRGRNERARLGSSCFRPV